MLVKKYEVLQLFMSTRWILVVSNKYIVVAFVVWMVNSRFCYYSFILNDYDEEIDQEV